MNSFYTSGFRNKFAVYHSSDESGTRYEVESLERKKKWKMESGAGGAQKGSRTRIGIENMGSVNGWIVVDMEVRCWEVVRLRGVESSIWSRSRRWIKGGRVSMGYDHT